MATARAIGCFAMVLVAALQQPQCVVAARGIVWGQRDTREAVRRPEDTLYRDKDDGYKETATTSSNHEGDCDIVMGGFHCHGNGGGCHTTTTRSSCRDMCLNDAKCQMYEWQPTDGHCCLEHCTPPSVTVPGVSSCPVWDGTKGWKEGQGAHVCSGPLGDNREWTNYLLQRTPTRGCPSTTGWNSIGNDKPLDGEDPRPLRTTTSTLFVDDDAFQGRQFSTTTTEEAS